MNEIVNESYVFSKDDLYINYDKFESGRCNICLVTGLSGSGKSTIAQEIARKNNAEWIELDNFEHCYIFTDDQLKQAGQVFYDYLSSHRDVLYGIRKDTIKGKDLENEISKFLHYCISWCRKDKSKKYVIEGVQIYSFVEFKDIKSYPLIIKNTSMLKSIIQRWKRNGDGKIDLMKELRNEFPQMVAWYKDEEKMLNNFRKSIVRESNASNITSERNSFSYEIQNEASEIINEDLQAYQSNFKKKKTNKKFKYLSIKDPQAKSYLEKDKFCKSISKYLKDYNGEIVVDDDNVVGYVFVGDKVDKGFIHSLEVYPKYRGYGIGGRLINDAITKYGGIDLTVNKNNELAIDIYKRRGFIIDDSRNAGKSMHYMVLKSHKNESVAQEASRADLPNSEFGLPDKRKYPLNDAKHVRSAVKFFNYVDPEDEAELARNIKRKAKEHGVIIRCGKGNRLSKYISKEYVNEFMAAGSIGNCMYAVNNGNIKQHVYQGDHVVSTMDKYPYIKKKKNDTKKDESLHEGKIKKPAKCKKCGSSNIGVYIKGEPVFLCKDCGEYNGTVPCRIHEENDVDIDDSMDDTFFDNIEKHFEDLDMEPIPTDIFNEMK